MTKVAFRTKDRAVCFDQNEKSRGGFKHVTHRTGCKKTGNLNVDLVMVCYCVCADPNTCGSEPGDCMLLCVQTRTVYLVIVSYLSTDPIVTPFWRYLGFESPYR